MMKHSMPMTRIANSYGGGRLELNETSLLVLSIAQDLSGFHSAGARVSICYGHDWHRMLLVRWVCV